MCKLLSNTQRVYDYKNKYTYAKTDANFTIRTSPKFNSHRTLTNINKHIYTQAIIDYV